MEKGIDLIAKERERQITEKGHTAEGDDTLTSGQLAMAAFCYCLPPKWRPMIAPSRWMDMIGWEWKPGERKKELIKAGAFIAAEIDRIIRMENK